jgi:HEPN domain-containing protein
MDVRRRNATAPVEDDEDEMARTTSLGLFNVAESYWRAAAHLKSANLKTTHQNSPVWFLFYHAIELYLKALLRHHGHTPRELRGRKFGHKTCCLSERAAKLGLDFDDEDKEVLSLMATTDAVIRSRYIQTGPFRWPSPEALDRTCISLRDSIGSALKKDGVTVRLNIEEQTRSTDESAKRMKMIKHLEAALALADETQDGMAGDMIESALDEMRATVLPGTLDVPPSPARRWPATKSQ